MQTIQKTLGFYQSEYYFQKKEYLQAADHLSQIFEKNQRILAHFPYKITSYLKQIFNHFGILSAQLNQLQTNQSDVNKNLNKYYIIRYQLNYLKILEPRCYFDGIRDTRKRQ
ncbi:hypothetical protein ABPG72_018230 [Tetrahymena utriculariae]